MTTTVRAVASASIAHPAQEVWARLSDFGDLSWAIGKGVEGVELDGDGIGMLRRVRVAGGAAPVVEQLTALDEESRSMTYAIIEGALPRLDDYSATARVTPTDHGCEVHWECCARAEEPALLETLAGGLVAVFSSCFT